MLKKLNYRSDLLNDLRNDIGYAAKYLSAALADSQEAFLVALRDVAEANKMARVAEDANVSRESLYRTLSREGNPTLSTLNAVLDAVGLQMAIAEKQPEATTATPPTTALAQTEANASILSGTVGSLDLAGAWITANVMNMNTGTTEIFSADESMGEQIPDIPVYLLGAQISQRQEAEQS